jgi:hypothetical protein
MVLDVITQIMFFKNASIIGHFVEPCEMYTQEPMPRLKLVAQSPDKERDKIVGC